jgi:oxygen-independent coproporphyrinogen-3 oxidase
MAPFTQPPWLEPRTAYLHVPFCGHHCGYCDFAVAAGQDHLIELYLDALEQELACLGEPRPVESLFIGGGTPTYLRPNQLYRLLTMVHHWLPIQTGLDQGEFSIESTPESLDEDKAVLLAAFGVNRVSIGVQSFRPHLLQALDRRHAVEQIAPVVATVRRHIPTLSFDLIFAAPGATLADWSADLTCALAFAPDHLSTYGLTYETGTPLWKQRQRGAVVAVPERDELAMYEMAIEMLTVAGFEHYEVSNFARPGKRCRHNERYWANEAYYGFGVGAARYVGGRRELNVRDTKLYIRRVLAGESPTFQSEELEPRQRAFETIAVQLRRADGIMRRRFQDQTGFVLDDLVGVVLSGLVELGLLADEGEQVRLTRRGFCVADGIIADVMKAST